MTTVPVFKQWQKLQTLESAATVSRHYYSREVCKSVTIISYALRNKNKALTAVP